MLKKRGPKPKPKTDDDNKIKRKYYIKIPPELKKKQPGRPKGYKVGYKVVRMKKERPPEPIDKPPKELKKEVESLSILIVKITKH